MRWARYRREVADRSSRSERGSREGAEREPREGAEREACGAAPFDVAVVQRVAAARRVLLFRQRRVRVAGKHGVGLLHIDVRPHVVRQRGGQRVEGEGLEPACGWIRQPRGGQTVLSRVLRAPREDEGCEGSEYSGMRSNAAEYVSCPLERWLGDKSTYSAASVSSRSTSDGSPSTEKA